MRIVALLVVLAVVGFLVNRQLKSTVVVPSVAASAPGGTAVPIQQVPKVVGQEALKALEQGAQQTQDKLKEAEGK
jgi:hypothetical protein